MLRIIIVLKAYYSYEDDTFIEPSENPSRFHLHFYDTFLLVCFAGKKFGCCFYVGLVVL